MSSVSNSAESAATTQTWEAANHRFLRAELDRLRLLLRRRVLWLRTLWKQNMARESQIFQGAVITDDEAERMLSAPADAQARFYQQDKMAQAISQKLEQQQRYIQECAQAALDAGGPPALEIITRLLQLGAFDRDVLLLCLAPIIDTDFDRLYAYLQDDATRKYPTLGLAMQVFGTEFAADTATGRDARWASFTPDAPLRRYQLVHPDPVAGASWADEPLRLDRRIASYLLGLSHIDEHVAAMLQPIEADAVFDRDQEGIVQRLERRLRAWDDRKSMPVIQLTGMASDANRAIARLVCARFGVSLYEIDPVRLPAAVAERRAYYRLLDREALMAPCAYYMNCAEMELDQRAAANQALEFVEQVQALIFVAGSRTLNSNRPLITARIPRSTTAAQLAAWKSCLDDGLSRCGPEDFSAAAETFLPKIVQQFNFSPQQIQHVVRTALEAAALRGPEGPSLEQGDLWLAARGHAIRSMEGLAERIEARRSLEELVLPGEQLQQIREIALQVAQRFRVYEEWGFGARLSRGRGIAALFAGPSGTGKTMAAEALARHLDLDLYRIDLAGVISKYIGDTEKNLRRVFDAAEESGAILFFDEADALFGKRSEVRDSHDRYANIEINYLLQRMEDYRGLAILATNRKSLLDQAFLRRLRFLVDFPFPSAADRVRIWRGAFPPQAETGALDFEFLGKLEVAGGNISNIALNAAFLAAGEGVAINMNHVLAAARREYAKIDKLATEGEFQHQQRTLQR